MTTESEEAAAYRELLAEAAKIQPSAEEVVSHLIFKAPGAPEGSNAVRYEVGLFKEAIERERLLGVLRERALQTALVLALAALEWGRGQMYGRVLGHWDEAMSASRAALYPTRNAAPPASDALSKVIEVLRREFNHVYLGEAGDRVTRATDLHEALRLLGEQP